MIYVTDANNLFYKIAFRLLKNNNTLKTESHKRDYINEFFEEVETCSQIRNDKSKMLFVRDSRLSWRKHLYKEIDYKGKRNKDYKFSIDGLNWCIEEIFKILSSNGIITLCQDKLEGDDLIAILTELFLSKGVSITIVTGDEDMYQLVRTHEKNYVICYNGDKKVFVGEAMLKEDSTDIFAMNSMELSINQNLKVVNPKHKLLEKILCGDNSDNIGSCFKWLYQNKMVGFTDTRFEAFINFDNNMSIDVIEPKDIFERVAKFLQTVKGCGGMDSYEVFEKGFHMNKKMIELKTENIPSNILKESIDFIMEEVGKNFKTSFVPSKEILRDTPYYISLGKNEKSFLDIQ